MGIKKIIYISLFAFGCNEGAEHLANDSIGKIDSLNTIKVKAAFIATHLSDTVFIKGNQIIFLRPDSARFASYEKTLNAGISEADADFGIAVSMAIDTIVNNRKFKNVSVVVSTKRFIQLIDCQGGPITIDRDTVNFGIIMTSKGKKLKAEQNIYPGEHYINVIRNYYKIKK
jgi:hypothetical protein